MNIKANQDGGTYRLDPNKRGIDGIFLKDLKLNIDDRGALFELARVDWSEVFNLMQAHDSNGMRTDYIQQVYIVQNHEEAIRAFHKHEYLVDLFCLTNGSAKFILIDDRPKSPTFKHWQIVNVHGRKPQLLGVPAGVFHGWKGSKDCTLVCVANQLYMGMHCGGKLDEERIPWDFVEKRYWDIEFK